MATYAQLSEQLKLRSYTFGWGAVAVFDGARIAQPLADHYSLMFHGPAAVKPVNAERIDIIDDRSAYASLDGIVLEAPRVSFISNSLQDSRMLVSFKLAAGVYAEYSERTNHANRVSRLINAGVGREYSFSFEVEVDTLSGTIDRLGQVRLKVGKGIRPLCDLGSTPRVAEIIGGFLLEQINLRYANFATELPLGWIETQRGHALPQRFLLRTQAKPGSTTGEGALVLFISHPNGDQGSLPLEDDFPYLIPDDSAANYSATVLVSRSYLRLLDGEAVSLFGQLLFPLQQYFTALPSPTDTMDEVIFGRFTPRAAVPPVVRRQVNLPGVAAQVITREVGSSAQPVLITASNDPSQVWEWSLETSGLGSLDAQDASATYLPPDRLEAGVSAAVQRVRASHRGTGKYHEVYIVLQSGPSMVNILTDSTKTPALVNFRPGFTQVLETDNPFATLPDATQRWTVIGQGTFDNGSYTAPSNPSQDVDVIIYQCVVGPMTLFGYCIVQFADAPAGDHWDTIILKLKSVNTGGRPYANGIQQLAIEVTLDTLDGKPVLQEELDTLRLIFKDGTDVPFLPATVEGLKLPSAADGEQTPHWAFKTERNRYQLARVNDTRKAPQPVNATRTVTLYLHSVAETTADFAVRLTDIFNREHTSQLTPSPDGDGLLSVEPRRLPGFSLYQYHEEHNRVEGKYESGDPNDKSWTSENPNNDWNFTSIDYWHYSLIYNQERLEFVRLQWESDGPGVRWETQAANEDAFSYLGYMLIGGGRPPYQQSRLQFGSALYDPVLYNNPAFDGVVPGSIVEGNRGDIGTLLISLHRVLDVFYRQKALIPGFDLERSAYVSLWDENGTRHRSEFGFEASGRVRVSRNTLGSSTPPCI